MKCELGHEWADCICPDEKIMKQETRASVIYGLVLLGVILFVAGIIGMLS